MPYSPSIHGSTLEATIAGFDRPNFVWIVTVNNTPVYVGYHAECVKAKEDYPGCEMIHSDTYLSIQKQLSAC